MPPAVVFVLGLKSRIQLQLACTVSRNNVHVEKDEHKFHNEDAHDKGFPIFSCEHFPSVTH